MRSRLTRLIVPVMLLSALSVAAQDTGLELKPGDQAPPTELAASIRDALSPESLQLTSAEGPVIELWLRKDVPLERKPQDPEDALRAIQEGTLLGVVRFTTDRRDFRDDRIAAGLYTMRFVLQPQDGDHMGTAPNPYFVLLTAADADTGLDAPKGHDEVVKLAQQNLKHPRSLNLRPAEDTDGQFPRTGEGFDDTRILWVKLPAKPEGGDELPLVLGLVYEGHGEI